jgi:uncharacterized cofD-like protein
MNTAKRSLRVAVLGGGNGIPTVLRGLADLARAGREMDVAAIVATADDGGSSGRLRRERGGLPPGDLRNCLLALADDARGVFARLFGHRYGGSGDLAGHSLGNLVLMALSEQEGCYLKALDTAGRLLRARGRVLPASLHALRLEGETVDGARVSGESRIGIAPAAIHRVWLDPTPAEAAPGVLEALGRADLIVLGPGSLFTSLLPVLLVDGVADAIRRSHGLKVLIGNIMTQPGETSSMTMVQHLHALDRHVGAGLVEAVLLNATSIAPERLRPYADQNAELVSAAGLSTRPEKVLVAPLVSDSGKIRHDSARLAGVLMRLVSKPATARPSALAAVSPRGGSFAR